LGKARAALLTDVDEQWDAIEAASRAKTLSGDDPTLEAEADALLAQARGELRDFSAGGPQARSAMPWKTQGPVAQTTQPAGPTEPTESTESTNPEPEPAGSGGSPARKPKFCIACGTALTGSGKFCVKCGHATAAG
jgi:hypothetical protein